MTLSYLAYVTKCESLRRHSFDLLAMFIHPSGQSSVKPWQRIADIAANPAPANARQGVKDDGASLNLLNHLGMLADASPEIMPFDFDHFEHISL